MVAVNFPIPVDADSPFPIQNIPFAIFSPSTGDTKRAGVAIGEYVLDLAELEAKDCFHSISSSFRNVFSQPTLNTFAALPRQVRAGTRDAIIQLLSDGDSVLFHDGDLNQKAFHQLDAVSMHLPMQTTEFTDYSAAQEHVGNCYAMTGLKFQEGNNFFFSPIGYTGRCSSLQTSGTAISRPQGVYKNPNTGHPEYQPTVKLDYELEMAMFVSKPVPYGQRVTPDEATDEHIFGFVLINDWSARDIQMYESVPVGPVNSKAFATTLSPWVVMPEALAAAAAAPYGQKLGQVPSHISHASLDTTTYDIDCTAFLSRSKQGDARKPVKLSHSNVSHMFYSPGQLIAHRASTGCGLVIGELIGMGTVSSPEAVWPNRNLSRAGCLFEMTWDGKQEVAGGYWLEDGDSVRLEAWATGANEKRIGFGSVTGTIRPAATGATVNGHG